MDEIFGTFYNNERVSGYDCGDKNYTLAILSMVADNCSYETPGRPNTETAGYKS